MRKHGTLSKWNDDRGFGFITPATGSGEIFVHISAFPRDGTRPNVGELISYETERGKDGRQRAVRVMRPGHRPPARPTHVPDRNRSRDRKSIGAWSLLIAAGLGAYGYSQYAKYTSRAQTVADYNDEGAVELPEAASRYRCDGRTRCSQMSSCAEATYFTQHCPGAAMDGDGDGVPCEDQWCGH